MIKVENLEVMNLKGAFRGMRNPLESWHQSDSYSINENDGGGWEFIAGDNDLDLALRLVKAGNDHSKFMRQIFVCMDITAPLYWWKEFDTYKVATVANSTSTMHKLGSRLLVQEDFSWDKMTGHRIDILNHLNSLIIRWQQNKEDKELWREIIQDLPDSFIQKRTWTANYATLRNQYHNRKNHKLIEWRDLTAIYETLPCGILITTK